MSAIVIIGGGHAASEAISSLKRFKWEGDIVLISEEPLLPYQRPPLSKAYLQDALPAERIFIRGEKAYEGVTCLLGKKAVKIDRQIKQVHLDDGSKVSYHKLIVATGARVRKLDLPGSDHPSVHYLRSKADVDLIKGQITEGGRILVVGGGYIGLEVAASARKLGMEVDLVEVQDRVLARVTSPELSAYYEKIHRENGVKFHFQAAVSGFEEASGKMQALCSNGKSLSFDLAVIGIGIRPNTEILEEAGIECEDGVLVNEYCQSSDPDIFAIGDCTRHHSFVYDTKIRLESVPNAVGQAKTAAMMICGQSMAYNEVPWFWSDQYDLKLQTVGLIEGYDQIVIRGNMDEKKFAMFYLKEGRLLAVDAVNSPKEFMGAKKLVAGKAHPNLHELKNPEVSLKNISLLNN